MNKPLVAAGALLLAGLGTAGVVYITSSGGEEEIVQQVATPTPAPPSPSATPSRSPDTYQTPTPTATGATSTPLVPEGWTAYIQPASDKSASFSLAYPDGWLFQPFNTTDPGFGLTAVLWSWTEGKPPPGAMKVDISVLPVEGFTSCLPEESTPASLGGQAAWRKDSTPDPSHAPGVSVISSVATDRGGFRYCIIGFLFEGYDPKIFDQLVESFIFTR